MDAGITFGKDVKNLVTSHGQVQFLLEKDFFCKISLSVLTNLFLKNLFLIN